MRIFPVKSGQYSCYVISELGSAIYILTVYVEKIRDYNLSCKLEAKTMKCFCLSIFVSVTIIVLLMLDLYHYK